MTCENQIAGTSGASWSSANVPDAMKEGSIGTATKISMSSDRLDKPADNYYASGIFIADKAKVADPANNEPKLRRFVPEADKKYVFGVKARSVEGNVRVGVGHAYGYGSNYSAGDHGKAGVQIGTDWTDFKATVKIGPITDINLFIFGIVTGAASDYVVVDPKTFYLAEEVPHSLTLEGVDGTTVMAGNETTFESKIFNQLGLPGYLDQNAVTFTVGDNLGNEVDGLTVTSEGNIATVSASIDVPAGEYYLRANYAIDEDTTWRKTIAVNVIENTDPYARDYVPSAAKPANLTEGGVTAGVTADWSGQNLPENMTAGSNYAIKIGLYSDRLTGVDSNWYASGIFLKDRNKNEDKQSANAFKPEANKNYVFSVKAKAVEGNVRVGLANNNNYGSYVIADHGREGIQVGTDWTEVKTAISIGDNSNYSFNYLSFGIVTGAASDYIVYDVPSIYLAEEVPHSITLEDVDGTEIVTGDKAEFEAQILNQLGLPGYLDQNAVTFTVGDNLGNAIDGLTVTSEGNIATVSVADGVAAGEYYLRANYAIDENTTWRKTLAFTVKEGIANTSDFVQPEKPRNLTTQNQSGGSNGGNWSSSGIPEEMKEGSVGVATRLFLSADKEKPDANYYAYGIFVADRDKVANPENTSEASKRFMVNANTNYVFEVKARSVEGDARIGIASSYNWSRYITGDHGAEGFPIGTDWTEFKTSISIGDTSSWAFNRFSFGIVTGTVDNFVVVDPASFYLAEEVAYEFDIDASAENVEQGKSIEIDATLLNQSGREGYLSQDFTWVAITDDRTEYLDGFTFVADAEDASKTTLTVAEDVAVGEYLIVAQNADEGVSKHYKVVVVEPTEEPEIPEVPVEFAVTGVEIGDDSVTVSFEGIPEAGKSVVLYIAKYLGGAFNGAEVKPITLTGENATESKPETFTKAEGETVKAFIWNPDMTALLETPATN